MPRTNEGFTLIELIIVLAIAGIVGTIGFNFFSSNTHTDWSTGTTTKCINGYVYVQPTGRYAGQLTQQFGADGKPDRCH